MRLLKQSSTSYDIAFVLFDATDHITPKTGLSPTVYISKNGSSSFTTASGTVSEIGNGCYRFQPASSDVDTLGRLMIRITATGADPLFLDYRVVAYDPYNADSLGLGRIDAAISSRLSSSDSRLNNLDAAVSSRLASSDSRLNNLDATISSRVASNDSRLSHLDAAVSSRLAAASYTAPDNAGISAIKSKTDKLTFDANNYVYAIATNAITDWTDNEKQQIRYRLGIDGTTQAPSTNAPHLGSTYSTLDDLATHVSTRLAASAYTPPDNASITAIKTKTDQLSFDSGKVAAKVSDPVSVSSSDISAIVDGVWDELISQHTTTGSAGAVLAAASDDGTSPGTIVCSPVVYPLQLSTAPRTSGPSITWYTGEKPAASFVIKSTDLTTKDVVLSVFALANPQEVLLEAAGSVAYSEATLTSTVNISLDELALAPSFAYRYILKNVTDDTVLASGPLYVISVPA